MIEIMPFDRDKPYDDLPDLPPAVQFETVEVLKQTIKAARALEQLRGISARLPNPRVLLNTVVLQEARLSSEVENIVTTNDELYRAAASPDGATDTSTKEVLRYREALWHGFQQIGKRPLTTTLFIELVEIIRQIKVGLRNNPGTNLKKSGEVIYTPPVGEDLLRHKLSNLEQYMYAEDGVDPLIKLAVMHYQFEAIHPFTDGNGRTGRILNVLYLVERKLLDVPVLYLSDYILRNKVDYYAGLRSVTEEHRWVDWLLFMLRGVEQTSEATCAVIQELLQQMHDATVLFRSSFPGAYSKDLIETVFSNPYCRVRFVEECLSVTRPTATQYLRKMVDLRLLSEVRVGRDLYYVNNRMVSALRPKPSLNV